MRRIAKSDMNDQRSEAPDDRDGYKLIFDLPPRTEVVSNSDEQLIERDNNTSVEENILLKQSTLLSGERSDREGKLQYGNSLPSKRNPLNGFLCNVIGCNK
ncbi:hypothetical protein [Roseivirga sp.]|uniref:hypothetical protein n=1 Tax=Roseivirga sp. TaxID=1964215 RepID=UPI002B26AD57|nr:hypothetical protein [Roseivirga sp.]